MRAAGPSSHVVRDVDVVQEDVAHAVEARGQAAGAPAPGPVARGARSLDLA